MSIDIYKIKLEDAVEIKNPELEVQGEMTNPTTVKILEDCKYRGKVTQIQDGLIYVGFVTSDGWVTQVFKPEELQEVK